MVGASSFLIAVVVLEAKEIRFVICLDHYFIIAKRDRYGNEVT